LLLNPNGVSVEAITSTVPVIVERTPYWPGSPLQWTGAHSSVGANAVSQTWGLAEGRGAYITATAPIAVERSMYWDANGIVWAAGTNALATAFGPVPLQFPF
jgi:hypothetical protein